MGKCKFNPAWRAPHPWAEPVSGDPNKYFCRLCVKSYSCEKGKSELVRHEGGEKHVKLANDLKFSENLKVGQKQFSIEAAFKKAESVGHEQRKLKDAALVAEAKFSNLMATHNIPGSFFDCFAVLLPQVITDSEIVKHMSLHCTKAFYTLQYGTAAQEKRK